MNVDGPIKGAEEVIDEHLLADDMAKNDSTATKMQEARDRVSPVRNNYDLKR